MTRVTCRLTAENRDQLRNPTLGNRVWTIFAIFWSVQDIRSKLSDREVIRGTTGTLQPVNENETVLHGVIINEINK